MNVIVKKRKDGTYDIIAKQGTTWLIELILKWNETTPINLTDYIVRSHIRRKPSSSVFYAFDIHIVDAQQGKVRLFKSATETAQIPAGNTYKDFKSRYRFDVEIQHIPSGVVYRVLEGRLFVSPEITK